MRCKPEEQLFTKSDHKEDVTCQEEDKELTNSFAYSCLKCGMMQCEKCVNSSGKLVDEAELKKITPPIAEFASIPPTAGTCFKLDDGDMSTVSQSEDVKENITTTNDAKLESNVERKGEPGVELRPSGAQNEKIPSDALPQSDERPGDCQCLIL